MRLPHSNSQDRKQEGTMTERRVRTHYDNLQVARNAMPEVIKAAYKGLAQRYHPDKNLAGRPESERVMRLINEAYSVLSNPLRRARHDRWIADMETPEGGASTDRLRAGHVGFHHLPADIQHRLQERSQGRVANQVKVRIGGPMQQYLWMAGLSGWFAMLFVFASGRAWSTQAAGLLGMTTLTVALFIGANLHTVLRWLSAPLRRDLILTPVYLIKTWDEEVAYWPLCDLKDIQVWHRYENGMYIGSNTSLQFRGERVAVTIRGEHTAREFLEQLQTYERQARVAQRRNDAEYFLREDDFRNLELEPARPTHRPRSSSDALAAYGISLLAAALIYSVAYIVNLQRVLAGG
jgi:hypothetical protein